MDVVPKCCERFGKKVLRISHAFGEPTGDDGDFHWMLFTEPLAFGR